VSARLNSDAGISYTEFSYQILQGLDYLELHRQYGCVLQTGGSDQWGNLTSGTDLIHRVEGTSVHAFGTPLITNSDGTKFGKSEGNAIWLDAEMCSPYAMYQFWLNTDDRDVVERLKVFTFLGRDEIAEYERLVADEPFRRAAQKRLALEVTATVHGLETTADVIAASEALFGKGELASLDAVTLASALGELPHATVASGSSVIDALVATELVKSASEARRAIAQGGVSIDGEKVVSEDALVQGTLPGGVSVLRRGKKALAGLFVG
jgi:tyrosyl-tRNA synthetase